MAQPLPFVDSPSTADPHLAAPGVAQEVVPTAVARPNGYGKSQKLKSRKTLEGLFATGKSFTQFPVKAWYQPLAAQVSGDKEDPSPTINNSAKPHQIGVGVSSRNFKKATDRNRIKRLLREAYRLQKNLLVAPQPMGVFLLYVGKELPTQAELMVAVAKTLEKISSHV
ncbi:MAG: ribonuclease P protein component [Sphingobacteriia bacterium]|nr:MAG: ribonuclease P protein component [Sphingobacteriia bacterium]